MKKALDSCIFGVLYILVFTLIYVALYYGLSGFLFIFILILVYNIPSLLSVLILLFIELKRKKSIPKFVYFLTSIVFFFISFVLWNHDRSNSYSMFDKGIHIIILYSILSHGIAFLLFKIFKPLITQKNGI